MKNKAFFTLLVLFIIILMPISLAYGTIPPTPAVKIIKVGSDNVTAKNSTATFEVKCTNGISCFANWLNDLITISFGDASGGTTVFIPDTLESLTNVTDIGCALNQVIKVNSSAIWACADDIGGGGGGEANTASNTGNSGLGWWIRKTGVDLEFLNFTVPSGNLTAIHDSANDEIDFNLGGNVVITGGSPQTVTKNATFNGLSFGGIVDAVNNRIANLAIPFDKNDAQRKNRVGDVNMTLEIPANGTVLKFLASNNTAIWQEDLTGGAGGGNVTNLNDAGDVSLTSPAEGSLLQLIAGFWQDIIFKANDITCSAGQFFNSFNNQTGVYGCGTAGNATLLNDLGDVSIIGVATDHILQFDGAFWVNKLFKIDNQTAQTDFQIIGINNQTGDITTNQFSVNTNTCAVGDFVSSINNATGFVTCTTPTAGSGNATVLTDLGDVDTPSPVIGQVLFYNGTYWNATRLDMHDLKNVTRIGCASGQILKVNSSAIWACAADDSGGAGADRISEGDSEVEVIDLGTGFIEVGIDGIMEYNFTLNYLNMSTNELNFRENIEPTTVDANNIQVFAVDKNAITTLYAKDEFGINHTLQNIPKPYYKKTGNFLPISTTQQCEGILCGQSLPGTEVFADDTEGFRISSTTGTTAGGDAGYFSGLFFHKEWDAYLDTVITKFNATNNRMFVGFGTDTTMDNNEIWCDADTCAGIAVRSTDTNYIYITSTGVGSAVYTDSGIAQISGNVITRMQVWLQEANNRACFQINSNARTCVTSEVPAPTTDLAVIVLIENNLADNQALEYFSIYAEQGEDRI